MSLGIFMSQVSQTCQGSQCAGPTPWQGLTAWPAQVYVFCCTRYQGQELVHQLLLVLFGKLNQSQCNSNQGKLFLDSELVLTQITPWAYYYLPGSMQVSIYHSTSRYCTILNGSTSPATHDRPILSNIFDQPAGDRDIG